MGALLGNLFGRTRRDTEPAETYRFVCYLDRLPPHILEEEGFRQRSAATPEVECELEAEDFGAAVAEAISVLEYGFARVEAIERLSP